MHRYEALLQEKSKQLCEKDESLIVYQSTTVKHILDLVVALKDKLDQQVVLDENKKNIDLYRKQVAKKEHENVIMR